MASDCQRHCYEEVGRMIRRLVGNMAGVVESIYFQEDADYKADLKNEDASNEALNHRFLLSFTAPCLHSHQPGMSQSYTVPENGISDGGTSQSQSPLPVGSAASQAYPNGTTAYYEVTPNHLQALEENGVPMNLEDPYMHEAEMMMMREQLNARAESEAVAVDMGELQTDNNNTDENFGSSEGAEYTELTNFPGILFPLSNEELHAAIDQQLSKSTPDPKPMEWGHQLFNSLNCLSSESDTSKFSPQQQSSEVSSSSGTYVPTTPPYNVNNVGASATRPTTTTTTTTATTSYTEESISRREYIPNVNIPYSSFQQLGNGPMNIIIAGTEILQQEGVAPAKLPAVSSLFQTGNYHNFSWTSAAENKAPDNNNTVPVQQVVRVTKQLQFQRQTSRSGPALLLPKPKSSSSAEPRTTAFIPKSRSRKKSPLGRNKEQPTEVEPTSMFSDTPSNAPKGHTYESWILQEGLYKVRKQGLHKSDDKDFCPYACPACEKRYKNPNGIKYHAKYAHGPKNIFFCDICKREYSTRHGLAAHKRTHSPETFSPPRATTRAHKGTC